MSVGSGIACAALCAIPIVAMLAKDVQGGGVFFALVFAIAGVAIVANAR